jgi:class 3 adenylate cyclase
VSESPSRLSHRLTVVWFTDLVGYSSLAARDQDEAVALVQRFQAIVEATVQRTDGRVVKFTRSWANVSGRASTWET